MGPDAHSATTLEPDQLWKRRDNMWREWFGGRLVGGLEVDWRPVLGWIGGGLAWIGVDWHRPRQIRDLRNHEFLPISPIWT